jgi:hypothetical protein
VTQSHDGHARPRLRQQHVHAACVLELNQKLADVDVPGRTIGQVLDLRRNLGAEPQGVRGGGPGDLKVAVGLLRNSLSYRIGGRPHRPDLRVGARQVVDPAIDPADLARSGETGEGLIDGVSGADVDEVLGREDGPTTPSVDAAKDGGSDSHEILFT